METTDKVYLYGASGHAKVVMDIAKLTHFDVPCLIDDNPAVNELAGVPVVHSSEGLTPIIVTIGDCQIRRRIVEKLGARDYLTLIHPSAVKAERQSRIRDQAIGSIAIPMVSSVIIVLSILAHL